MECSSSVPAPGHRDVAAPRRPVVALDREELVVAEDDGHGPAQPARRHHLAQGDEHRRGAQDEPDLGGHARVRHGRA